MRGFATLAKFGVVVGVAGLACVLIGTGGAGGPQDSGKAPSGSGTSKAKEQAMTCEGMFDPAVAAQFKSEAGVWDLEVTFWFHPGAQAVVSKCVMTSEPILGGMFLRQSIEGGTFGPEMGNAPWSSISICGYNPSSKQYETVRLGSSTSIMIVVRGEAKGEDRPLELLGEYSMSGMKCTQRDVTFRDGPDRRRIESWMKFGDMLEFKGAEIRAVRRK